MSYTLPQANVRLTEVATPGHEGDYDRPPGDPVVKWHGAVGAYLQEKLVTNLGGGSGGSLDRVRQSTLIIPGDLAPRIELAEGDIVKYQFQDGATKNWHVNTRTIQSFAVPQPPAPALPTTVHLSLIDAPA